MSATRTDIVELPDDYVPLPGERIWLVIVPSTWSKVLYGRDFWKPDEATKALTAAKRKIEELFGTDFKPLRAQVYPVEGSTIKEIHLELEANGTPAIGLLIALGIGTIGLGALAFTMDRVYKITERAPVVAGLGFGTLLLLGGLAAVATKQLRGGA